MKLHPHLKIVKQRLESQSYIVGVKEETILQVCMEDDQIPFCFILVDIDTFHGIIVSFAADFPFSNIAADIAINLMHVAPVAVGESYYIDSTGETFWGEEAIIQNSRDEANTLDNMQPISQLKH